MVNVFTDSDWGGCPVTMRSTSGCILMLGNDIAHTHSRTQNTVYLSSAEAELVATAAGIQEALLAVASIEFWTDQKLRIQACGDSSVAKGVMNRHGVGRIKHRSLKVMWIQGLVQDGSVVANKIPRSENPSDLLTHHWTRPEWTHMHKYFCVRQAGQRVGQRRGRRVAPAYGEEIIWMYLG